MIRGGTEDPKKWWTLLKNIVGFNVSADTPPLVHNDMILYSDEEKCEAFNNYFKSIATLEVDDEPDLDFSTILSHPEMELSCNNISENDVRDQLKILKT